MYAQATRNSFTSRRYVCASCSVCVVGNFNCKAVGRLGCSAGLGIVRATARYPIGCGRQGQGQGSRSKTRVDSQRGRELSVGTRYQKYCKRNLCITKSYSEATSLITNTHSHSHSHSLTHTHTHSQPLSQIINHHNCSFSSSPQRRASAANHSRYMLPRIIPHTSASRLLTLASPPNTLFFFAGSARSSISISISISIRLSTTPRYHSAMATSTSPSTTTSSPPARTYSVSTPPPTKNTHTITH